MSSRIIKVTDDMRIILGKEAKEFAYTKGVHRGGRMKHEVVKNRFIGNCRHYIYSQVIGCAYVPIQKEQGFTLIHKYKKVLVKPYYSTNSGYHKKGCVIGPPTHYLTNPEFDFIALVHFWEQKSEGYVKAVIPKKIFINNSFISEAENEYIKKVFIDRDIVEAFEYRKEMNV